MQDFALGEERLPEFDAAFQNSSPFFYFHHIIDPDEATLRVEVIGPNLTYTFRHDRAKRLISRSEIATRLEIKTVGFLALVAEGGMRRIVLAWAESGHGQGIKGDILEAGPSLLPNELWTRRVMAIAKQLAISLRHPFDGNLARLLGYRISGIHAGSHVEVKLAVHAVFVLLRIFNITHDFNNVSRRDLRQLREVRWEDGSKPSFEVYFSRKPCGRCSNLVSRLEKMTGISIRLVWKDRLVKVVYKTSKSPNGRTGTNIRPRTTLGQYIDLEDEELIEDDVIPIDCVDLTHDPALPPEIVSLLEEEDGVGLVDDPARRAVDAYIDGLAYCVGQIDQHPQDAQNAIIDLAETVRRQRNVTDGGGGGGTRRAQAPKNHAAWSKIAKPLPATPQMELPWWMTGGSAPPAATIGGNRREPIIERVPVVERPVADLPTPPASGSKPFPPQSTSLPLRSGSKSPLVSLQERRRQPSIAHAQFRQRSPRRYYSVRPGERMSIFDGNAAPVRPASIRVEFPSRRRRMTESPDPF
ncbi:hypothetical protein PT974_05159 [Cladobotryum mycophilum]|uniref:Uncharacterized protein n=1 Tax=Cladobotryum mycophilum TaxID=491253 RepID=A0ABR0SR68_9HYPO